MNDQIAEMVHDVEPWVRPSVDRILDEYGNLPELTWSLLHADPESEAFLSQPDTGQVALIDWRAHAASQRRPKSSPVRPS